MIYPTRRAVMVAAAGAPVALAVAAVATAHWYVALTWPIALVAFCLLDAWRGRGSATANLEFPEYAYVGGTSGCTVHVSVSRRTSVAQVQLETSPLVQPADDGRSRVALKEGRGAVLMPLEMKRRGLARFDRLWLRWAGPFGLTWQQRSFALDAAMPILPDIRPVHRHGATTFQRHALEGWVAQLNQGEGLDFDELLEFRPGMDRRSIDWKQSARHMKLLSKRWRSERNNQIVFAVDSGRQMCEPVAGLPRVDRCVSAMLLNAWVALKLGDRVAIHAFDSRPRLSSGFVSSAAAFREIERLAAQIDYSGDETNYTFALSSLAGRLKRRSLIVLFTEFTDTISADFLYRSLRLLVETHLVLIVVLQDEEVEAIAAREPQNADDVTRAITAAALLKERRVLIGRAHHLGVHVIESEYDRVSERLVQGYLQLKRRNLL
ncbi:MAG: DUF58 domain-containing protein [Sphingomonas sp.]|nr:DUF58 domain-containing protein [Sphingomonas sp.]